MRNNYGYAFASYIRWSNWLQQYALNLTDRISICAVSRSALIALIAQGADLTQGLQREAQHLGAAAQCSGATAAACARQGVLSGMPRRERLPNW